MKIKRLYFRNHVTGWNVNEVCFDNLTLLVGASGVGKTQILRAIQTLKKIADGNSANGVEWAVDFVENGVVYSWKGEFEAQETNLEDIYHFKHSECAILSEKLEVNSKEVITREKTSINYEGNPTIKLDANKSVIALLKEEDTVAPVATAFQKIYFFNSVENGLKITPSINEDKNKKLDLQEIKTKRGLSPFEKLFLLKINDLPEFENILEDFCSIFPLVEDLDFAIGTFFNDWPCPILKLKEKNVESWIFQPNISSGMLRTLSQIIMLTLADKGDVFLIDEFENGLGVNCINQLAELIMYPEENVQVIMTSHHPYIINTIPFECWKIVTRQASDVTIHSARELNIGKHSKHEAFMQLLQSSAYKTGSL